MRMGVGSRGHRARRYGIGCNRRCANGSVGHGTGLVIMVIIAHVARSATVLIETMLTTLYAAPANGARSFHRCLWLIGRVGGRESGRGPSFSLVRVSVILAGPMLPHAHIPTDADSTALVSNKPAQLGTLAETGKFLGTEDLEWPGPDIETCGHVLKIQGCLRFSICVRSRRRRKLALRIRVSCFFCSFQQTEAETIPAFVADRQVGKDEISRRLGTLEIVGPGEIDALQRCYVGRSVEATACDRSSILQRST
jgi:hypothetical protein